MYGYDKSYGALLKEADLETLEERRKRHFKKFAEKASENDNYRHLFPKNISTVRTSNPKVYREEYARSDRLYNSPLFAMRRILNGTPPSDRYNNPNYLDLSHLFNEPN